MTTELENRVQRGSDERSRVKPEVNRLERNRLIAHLGRVFSRRYDIQVLPSGQKGIWACGLDPKVNIELQKYIGGQRDTLDDLPTESFTPKQILYDAESAQEMSMDQITTILHHEAGHVKFSDFKSMIEGQRQAKNEGHLPTSFWLAFEGIEDPRVNSLEGEESPAIDRQIRTNQAKDLQERLIEAPLHQRPMMMQFAYNSFHHWLHGQPIKELEGTDVGRATELARPLLEQYFQNTDIDQRRILQNQIWDIVKPLEKKDIEDEKKRQMAKKKGMSSGKGKSGQGQSGQPQTGSGEGQQSSSQSGQGEGEGQPRIPGGTDTSGSQEQESQQRKRFLQRVRDAIFGKKKSFDSKGDQQNASQKEPEPEKIDLSKLTPEELQEIKDAIDQLSPDERAELAKKAREAVDEEQKEALEKELSRILKLEKNKETGEYEAIPQIASEEQLKQAEKDFQEALQKAEAEEQAEGEEQEGARKKQEGILRKLEAQRREKLEMEKAGFDPAERDKFLLYQALENSMYANVRNFRRAMEKVMPRKQESIYEGGYFTGTKFDRRDLIRKAPLGNEQFHMRPVEIPIGESRIFTGLVVDNSGSMAGKKAEVARKSSIFLSKVNRDMNIPFMGVAFGTDAEAWKEFRQDFDDPTERIKPKLIGATAGTAMGTNLHKGIKLTIEAMNEQRRRLKDSYGIIYVITDGGANRGLVKQELKDYIEENRGRLVVKALGLSGSPAERAEIQQMLNFYFGEENCVYPQGFEDLPDEVFRILRTDLIRFKRFLS